MVHQQSGRFTSTIEFNNKIEEAISKILVSLNNHQNGIESFSNEKQLIKIKNDLLKMKDVKSSKNFTPSFPKIIVDSWGFSNKLGIELLRLFEFYKKAK